MIRGIAVGLGILTTIAAVGVLTPSGKAMRGVESPGHVQSLHVIPDPFTGRPATHLGTGGSERSRLSGDRRVLAPTFIRRSQPAHPMVLRSTVRYSRAPRSTAVAVRHPIARPTTEPGTIVDVATILLNLPQVLSRTEVRAAPGPVSDEGWERHGHFGPGKVRDGRRQDGPGD